MFDDGSSCSLITRKLAASLGLPARQVSLYIKTINGVREYKTDLFVMNLLDKYGKKYTIRAYGVEEISQCLARNWTVALQAGFSLDTKLNWPPNREEGMVELLRHSICTQQGGS